jgi:hypothetical protein
MDRFATEWRKERQLEAAGFRSPVLGITSLARNVFKKKTGTFISKDSQGKIEKRELETAGTRSSVLEITSLARNIYAILAPTITHYFFRRFFQFFLNF